MRCTLFSILFTISFTSFSGDFTVFEKNGFFGVKDSSGEVTVPPVYEKLGWSSGGNEVYEGLIGYKQGNLWGLISVRNKALTDQKFYSLEPFADGYIKGSIKGKFSNHLFYGLLDSKGRTIVSFNYFELSLFNKELLVSEFNSGKQSYGLVSFANELLIPLKYKKISQEGDFIVASTFSHTLDIFYNNTLVKPALDSIRLDDGLIGFQAGYAGFIDSYGKIIYDFNSKSIETIDGEIRSTEFPVWKTYLDHEIISEWQCDSLKLLGNGIWVSFLNGAQHIAIPGFNAKDYIIKKLEDNLAIVQHTKTRKYAVVNSEGKRLINGYDSIAFSQTHFLGLRKEKWDILSASGTKLNKQTFDQVLIGPKNFFITSKNYYWGVIDFTGAEYLTFKYDSIIYSENNYHVKYLNKWGVIDLHGNWKVQPEFSKIQSYDDISIGKRGLGYSVYYKGQFKFKMTYKPIGSLGQFVIIESDSSRVGALNKLGDIIANPNYSQVRVGDNFLKLKKNGFATLMHENGEVVFDENEAIQEIGSFQEGYFSIRRNNKWGFIDDSGRLKISNRYDSVQYFSESVAAVKLRNRWGFVNLQESLIIQPYYDEVSAFENQLSVVQIGGKVGIINKEGETILDISFNEVKRLPTHNYLVRDAQNRVGLVDSEGKFIIRPSYDYLKDTGNGLIVVQDGLWGYLDYSGSQKYKLAYSFVDVVENYVVVKILSL